MFPSCNEDTSLLLVEATRTCDVQVYRVNRKKVTDNF